jgi:hypothetical protein
MNLYSSFKIVRTLAVCAAVVACASTEPEPAGVVRGRAPQGYDTTIASYFAFKVRAPKNNVEISVDKPEPSDCPLDGYITSARGWVVPAVYATRTGAMTGKETIYITAKQYYFWFNGDTIAGVTTRVELCPGSATGLSEVTQALSAAEFSPTPRSSLPTARQAQSQDRAATTGQLTRDGAQDGGTASGRQRRVKTLEAKKTGPSSGSVRRVIKKGGSHKKGASSRHKIEAELKTQHLGAV